MRLYEKIFVFSASLRIWHWVNFLTIMVLFFTGLYIGNPFFIGSQGIEATYAYDKVLTMDFIRFIHFSAGYILLVSFLFRIFIAFFRKGDRLFIPKVWTIEYWEGIKETLLEYLLIKEHRPYVRNPLARTAYFFFYVLLFFMIATGFGMYGLSDPEGFWASLFGWVVWSLGGEFQAHMWHHWVAWIIILFFIVHVYFVSREDFVHKDGEVSSMFSGVKFFKEKPVDIEDVEEGK
ncbi:MAG: Ni/Fe-hydrogenase, b-type cytochrome subunit [Aquificae bacterium]|nr:Ni/Fe-hydrogenase, b-type cytochrome subunit [Aquificota bacterium]